MKSPKTSAEGQPIDPDEMNGIFAALNGRGVLLAVSGGPDSMALMGMAAQWRAGSPNAAICVATVDHGLRENAHDEAEWVGVQARSMGFQHHLLHWEGDKPAARVQEAARHARYALLTRLAHETGAETLLTAHTLDDQAETVLFRLMRGSGPAGLAGMRTQVMRDGIMHLRPLLHVAKARLVATCMAHGWPFVRDPSNVNDRFARARLRKVLPLLAGEGLSVPVLATLGARMAKVETALEAQTEALWAEVFIAMSENVLKLDGTQLVQAPQVLVERILQKALEQVQGASWQRLERIERCAADLIKAGQDMAAFRRSLGHCLVSLAPDGSLFVGSAPLRQRGRQGN